MSNDSKRELVLPPHSYAYMQDVTKGIIKTFVGPTVINQTAQEVPVYYEHRKGFQRAQTLEQAVRQNAIAVEGSYLELFNPASKPPVEGSSQPSPDLDIGRRVNIPGPVSFALWPGQYARAIRGHHLRHNQYLLCRVYNADEAEKNWAATIVKSATPASDTDKTAPLATDKTTSLSDAIVGKGIKGLTRPEHLAVGTKFIVRGDEVAFYIPPTGIVVEADGAEEAGRARYVREALTLERLEYCILVKENGTKRYERGPQVVFPEPDERFIEKRDDRGHVSRKFAAIELNEIQGIHLKVISAYEEGGKKYQEGQELFVTGRDTPIYYPREEHSVVRYDGKTKHFATAIPRGEARYVMDRKSGLIDKIEGPAMLLPNPVDQVIVRRALSDQQCDLWYPGNVEVRAYNQVLRGIAETAPTTRSGAVSEGELQRNAKKLKSAGVSSRSAMADGVELNSMAATSYGAVMEASRVSGDQDVMLDEFSRASTYTAPRSITLNTKYQGVPSLDVWTGYAVMVKDRVGNRRVVQGPQTILLAYDEDLEVMELSTGKPKTTDNILRTVYLRTTDNKVADVIAVETKDHVRVDIKLSYRVNFEGDPAKWFAVANYVKLLCDHGRSMLKGALRLATIGEFYADPTGRIRDILLGKKDGDKRLGMAFPENGMRTIDVDVLGITITDKRVDELLAGAQFSAVKATIDLGQREQLLATTKRTTEIDLEIANLQQEAQLRKNAMLRQMAVDEFELFMIKAGNDLKKVQQTQLKEAEDIKVIDMRSSADRARMEADNKLQLQIQRQEQDLLIERLRVEAETVVQRLGAAHKGFSEALLTLSNNETAIKVAQAWSIQEILGGKNLTDSLARVFANTPLAGWIETRILNRLPASNGNGTAAKIDAPLS